MRLDSTVFDSIAKTLGAVPDGSEPLRRRGAQRYNVDREISLKPFGVANATSRPVTLVNISATGICIVDRLPISSGDQFIAMLPLPGGASMNVLCIARQSRLTSTRAFRVGAEFTSEMERDARIVRGVGGVVAQGEPAAKSDAKTPQQRATLRFPMQEESQGVAVDVRKFTDGHFELSSPQPVAPGQQVILEFQFQQRKQAWRCTSLQMRAVSGGLYAVSLRIDGPVPTPAEKGLGAWLRRVFGSSSGSRS